MRGSLSLAILVTSAFLVGGCGKSKTDDSGGDKLGESLGNALILGMAEDQHKRAKEKYDRGEDATLDCIMDTAELRKDKSPKAQKLATEIDTLCEIDVPARAHSKELDKALADVRTSKTDKSQADMLRANQVILKLACEHTDEALKKMTSAGLGSEPNAKSLDAKKAQVCIAENLEGGPTKVARGKK
jgi:hypothetical protein